MVNRLLPYLGFMPWVVHRLDMHTSGAAPLKAGNRKAKRTLWLGVTLTLPLRPPKT